MRLNRKNAYFWPRTEMDTENPPGASRLEHIGDHREYKEMLKMNLWANKLKTISTTQ